MTTVTAEHTARIKQELRQAGVTRYGLLKGESRHLPRIIHPDEHIHGAIYGRAKEGSIMLVATDRRVIILDWKPLFTNTDEITYDVVSGVKMGSQGIFTSVTLHTRIKDYALKFVNFKCADRFVDYIEERRLEKNNDG